MILYVALQRNGARERLIQDYIAGRKEGGEENRQDKRGFDFIREVSRRGVMYHVLRSR